MPQRHLNRKAFLKGGDFGQMTLVQVGAGCRLHLRGAGSAGPGQTHSGRHLRRQRAAHVMPPLRTHWQIAVARTWWHGPAWAKGGN